MARQNLVFLLGSVLSAPITHYDDETGNPTYSHCYLTVVRGMREVGDRKRIKYDYPFLMTRDPHILKEMENWKENDIVLVKGTLATKVIRKGHKCPYCPQDKGKNYSEGVLVYINPIYARKIDRVESTDEMLKYLSKNREISNQAYIFGTLCRDPKKITPKAGLTVTQYQIALNRKYRIRTDPPEVKTDYPWVKSYGDNAVEDKERLHIGSQVFIDGCLQARSIQRHAICEDCGNEYTWKDRAMEIVPYETEYIANFYSDDEVAEKKRKALEDRKKNILHSTIWSEENEDDQLTDEDREEGYSDED